MKTKLLALLLALTMALGLCACTVAARQGDGSGSAPARDTSSAPGGGESEGKAAADRSDGEPVSVQATYPTPPADWEQRMRVLEDNPVDSAFLESLNRFALHSGAQILKGEGGCFSPLSLYYALALAAEGARGQTAEELHALLGMDGDALGEQCSNLFRRLYADDEEGTVLMANSLWMDEEVQGVPVHFREEYLKKAAERYYASLFTVDFSDAAAGQKIGDWVYENTHERLRFEPEVNEMQLLAILNTVYFNSPWWKPFEEELTGDDSFTRADGTEQTVPFMHREEEGDFYRGEDYAVASLGLHKGQMTFYLPDEGVDVHSLLERENLLDQPEYEEAADQIRTIQWSVPKFACESRWSVIPALQALGLKLPFSGEADFSGLTDTPAKITAIEQGTRMGVDENGVEAAAYTYMALEATGISLEEPEVVEMNLNRPFLYTITGEDGVVLFLGICDQAAPGGSGPDGLAGE